VFGYTLDDASEPAAHGQGEQFGPTANVDISAVPFVNEPSSLRSQSLSTQLPPPSIHIQASADPGLPQPPTGRANPSSTTLDTHTTNFSNSSYGALLAFLLFHSFTALKLTQFSQ
jgi:hypothetical protein